MKMQFIIFIVFILFISCSNPSQNKKDAERFFKENNYENALSKINKAIKVEPDSINYYILRMRIYDNMGLYKEEVSDLSKIIELNKNTGSKSLNVHHQRAVAQIQLGLYNEALDDINYFIEKRDTVGSLAEAYLNKASILYKLNDYKKSEKYYKLAIKETIIKELKSQAFVGLANLEKSPQRALKLLDKAIFIDNKSSLAYGARAALYIDLGKSEEAFDNSKKAISLNPNDAIANLNLGQLYVNYSNNLDSAILYFNKALELSPQAPENDLIYMNKGVINNRLNKLEDALLDFQKGEIINPKNDLLLYNFAYLLSDMGKDSDALDKVSKAIKYNNKDPEYFNLKGILLLKMSKFNEAEIEFIKAIKLNPSYGSANYNLGYLNGEIGNHNKSIKYYEKAVKLNFDLEATLVNLALQKIKIDGYDINYCGYLKF